MNLKDKEFYQNWLFVSIAFVVLIPFLLLLGIAFFVNSNILTNVLVIYSALICLGLGLTGLYAFLFKKETISTPLLELLSITVGLSDEKFKYSKTSWTASRLFLVLGGILLVIIGIVLIYLVMLGEFSY